MGGDQLNGVDDGESGDETRNCLAEEQRVADVVQQVMVHEDDYLDGIDEEGYGCNCNRDDQEEFLVECW